MNPVEKRKISVVSADIDATLTWMGSDLSDLNRKAISDLEEAGILFGLASGRSYSDLKNYPEKWKLTKPVDFFIGLNGASLYDHKTGVDELFFEIEREKVKRIVEEIDHLDLDSHIYANGITLFSKPSTHYQHIKKVGYRDIRLAKDLSDMYQENTPKILINVQDENMAATKEHFAPILEEMGNTVKLIRTSPGAMEFVPAAANKFYAMKIYCDRYDIPMEEVVAFGDTTNDNEMIAGAGLGVCMANGTDDTKALADVITEYPASEDGFARYVYEYIL